MTGRLQLFTLACKAHALPVTCPVRYLFFEIVTGMAESRCWAGAWQYSVNEALHYIVTVYIVTCSNLVFYYQFIHTHFIYRRIKL